MWENGLFGKFYRFGDVVFLLLYVNLLWLCFTLIGLILFGIGPSTVAMFKVFREYWMGEERDMLVFKTFKDTFKQEFWRANGLGILLMLIPYMLYINMNFLELNNQVLAEAVHILLILAASVYGMMLLYIFPMYVHYDNRLINYLKNSLLIAIYHPVRTIYALAACVSLYYLFFTLPVFLFFFGGSLTSFILMWIAYRTFLRMEYRQHKLRETIG
ncbi:YesL family protein [Gracilibacillus phocaeensis]|uniref:YesL family protein n=1 Tax=Gracilibacillus phocaeensis TaxID=2042304 RepID=UPI00102F41D4|nr:DUF624 domain-containing protein [Gracilibacillus phocaeensis]